MSRSRSRSRSRRRCRSRERCLLLLPWRFLGPLLLHVVLETILQKLDDLISEFAGTDAIMIALKHIDLLPSSIMLKNFLRVRRKNKLVVRSVTDQAGTRTSRSHCKNVHEIDVEVSFGEDSYSKTLDSIVDHRL